MGIEMSKGKQDKSSGEAKEPVKVYKWDGTAVKNALDDAVKEVMTGKLPYTENFNLMDGRLIICAIAVGVAMLALLWDFLNPFQVKACSDWVRGLLLHPHGYPHPVHH